MNPVINFLKKLNKKNKTDDDSIEIPKLKSGGYEEETKPVVQRHCRSMPDRDCEQVYCGPVRAIDDNRIPRPYTNKEHDLKRRSCSVQKGTQRVHFRDSANHQSTHIQLNKLIERANKYKEQLNNVLYLNEEKESEIKYLTKLLKRKEKDEQLLREQIQECERKSYQQQQMLLQKHYQNQQIMQNQQTLVYSERTSHAQQASMYNMYNPPRNNICHYGGPYENNMGGPVMNYNTINASGYHREISSSPGWNTPISNEAIRIPSEAADTPSSMAHDNHQSRIYNYERKAHFSGYADDEEPLKDFGRQGPYSSEMET